MSKILLTSCGFYTDSIKNQFLQLVKKDISQTKATIITTASPKKENNLFAQKAYGDLKQMGFQHVDYTDLEFDNPHQLYDKDVI